MTTFYATLDTDSDGSLYQDAYFKAFGSARGAERYVLLGREAELRGDMNPADRIELVDVTVGDCWSKVPRDWVDRCGELTETARAYCRDHGLDPEDVIIRTSHPGNDGRIWLDVGPEIVTAHLFPA